MSPRTWSSRLFAYVFARKCFPCNLTALQALFLITTKGIPPLKDARKWTTLFRDFVGKCLEKDADNRIESTELLKHPFLRTACEPLEIVTLIEKARSLHDSQVKNLVI